MHFQYISYIWPLIASAFISLSLGIFARLRRPNAKGAFSFTICMIVVTIWSLGNSLEMSSVDFSAKLFWANVQYFAYCYSPVTLLALCMEFTGYDRWIRNKKVLWLTVIPTIIIILVWTDGLHGLIRYDMHMDHSGIFPVIDKKYGPAFYLHAVYSHILNIFAWVLLIKATFLKNTVYRKQAIALFSGVSFIVIPNILYISNLSLVKGFDVTPVFFGPAGLIIAWGIFRYKLFDVIPVAWAIVIKTMDAGVMVLDLQDRVLDINPAFEKIVGNSSSAASTMPIKEVCRKIPGLVNACMDRSSTYSEFSTNVNGLIKVYEVLISPLSDDRGILIGRLAITYDISEKKQEQQTFLKQQWKLAVTEERERLARDMHDNLGQVLGFINLQAQGIKQELMNAGVDININKLDKLIDATQSAHNEIREYIRNVRSPATMEKGFMSALAKDIINLEEQTGLKVKPEIPIGFTGDELEPDVQLNILNIIKEALNNVRKHAEANHVKIAFSLAHEQFCATIEDDGKGFDISRYDNVGAHTRYGLDIMRERALEIGAQLDIKSVEGKGSRIDLFVPIKEASDADEIVACR